MTNICVNKIKCLYVTKRVKIIRELYSVKKIMFVKKNEIILSPFTILTLWMNKEQILSGFPEIHTSNKK